MPRLPEFFAPWTLLAVLVLGVNDAVLKAAFHNVVTGKLSDFAGCFFLPLYVSALLRLSTSLGSRARLAIGVAVTLAIFVPTSLSRTAADLFCAALSIPAAWFGFHGLRIAADPTDLVALPMVWLAAKYGRSRMVTTENDGGDVHAPAA